MQVLPLLHGFLDCHLPPQVLTNQSAAVTPTSPAGMASVSLSAWCVMIKALTTVGMEVTWRKT